MTKRSLQDEIEILEMCLPIYCDAGGIWFRNNHNMADGHFKDWGAARAFAVAATALPALVKALEEARQFVSDAGCDEDDSDVVHARYELLKRIDGLVGWRKSP